MIASKVFSYLLSFPQIQTKQFDFLRECRLNIVEKIPAIQISQPNRLERQLIGRCT